MPSSALRGGLCALSAVLFTMAATSDATATTGPTNEHLLGVWSTVLEHAGARTTMRLELSPAAERQLVGRLSLPAIDLRDFALGPVAVDDGRVRTGPFILRWNEAERSLHGVMPPALVPVGAIPFVLRRDSRTPDAVSQTPPTASSTAPAAPLWSRRLDAPVWAGLAASGNILLVAADDGTLHALSTTTGAERWSVSTGARLRARPTIADDSLLLSSDSGLLSVLALEDGSERLRVSLGAASERRPLGDPQSRYEHFASSPLVTADAIYVANADGELLRLERDGGKVVWRFSAGDSITSTPAFAAGSVLVGSFDHHVYAVGAATGELLWRHNTGAPVVASPVVDGRHVLVGSRSYDLLALDSESGKKLWQRYHWFSWVEATAAVRDGIAYVGLSDGQLLSAHEIASGDRLWSFDTDGSIWSEPAVAGNVVFVGTVGVPGYMIEHRGGFFALDRKSGRELWRYPAPAPAGVAAWGFAAAPATSEGRVFAASLAGEVFAFAAPPRD